MRYMLYENENGKVKLSKEFEFIQSYIDLMKLRFSDDLSVNLVLPSNYIDIEIPPMLFVSFVENAFKHGASYQKASFISIIFEIRGNSLHLTCINSKHVRPSEPENSGLGLQNSKNRLDMLYGKNYTLSVNSGDEMFNVELIIPMA
jgi:LytS/YehU family sensor histidine kinase